MNCLISSINWNAINTITNIVMTIIIFVSARFAYNQIKEMKKQRSLSNVIEQFDKLNDIRTISTRRLIYGLNSIVSLDKNKEAIDQIEQFLNILNQVGFLMSRDYLPKNPTLEMFYITVLRCWYKLQEFIIEKRKERGIYMYHFQWLVEESLKYWDNRHPKSKLFIVEPTTGEKIELIRSNYDTRCSRNKKERYDWI